MKRDFLWDAYTPNHYVARVVPGVTVETVRSPSWKRKGLGWRIVVFGNQHISNETFTDLYEAQMHAEGIARTLVKHMVL